MTPRLKELFVKEIKPNLKESFGYKNNYMVPEIQKVVLNMGIGQLLILKSKRIVY